MSGREAESSFGIPRSTLHDKIKGRSEEKVLKRGRSQIIPEDIEYGRYTCIYFRIYIL